VRAWLPFAVSRDVFRYDLARARVATRFRKPERLSKRSLRARAARRKGTFSKLYTYAGSFPHVRHERTLANFPVFVMRYRYASALAWLFQGGSDPNGIRTRVTAVKGRCPRPLDDRVTRARAISELLLFDAR
jgi:hypothetical protein